MASIADEPEREAKREAEREAERPHWWLHGVNYLQRDAERARSSRRLWLHRAWHLYRDGEIVSCELAVPGGLAWRLELNGDEHPIAGRLGVGLFTFYWSLGWWAHKLPISQWMRRRYHYDAREIEVYWNTESGGLHWSLWMRPHEWRRSESRWRRGSFIPLDVVFGRQRYHKAILSRHEAVKVVIPGDPAPYSALVELEHPVWTRPRWPWWPMTRAHYTANIEIEQGIPIPGKGENSWDCDDDAVYGLSTPATTVEEAIAALVASVERSRQRYGGPDWRPPYVRADAWADENENESARGGTEA